MYENRRQPLLPRPAYFRRLLRHGGAATGIALASLVVGVLGYHGFEGFPWIDAFTNAAMILGGMGPLSPLRTSAGKLFAGCYALYSGMVFLAVAGIMLAPVVHRFLHRFHLDMDERAASR